MELGLCYNLIDIVRGHMDPSAPLGASCYTSKQDTRTRATVALLREPRYLGAVTVGALTSFYISLNRNETDNV